MLNSTSVCCVVFCLYCIHSIQLLSYGMIVRCLVGNIIGSPSAFPWTGTEPEMLYCLLGVTRPNLSAFPLAHCGSCASVWWSRVQQRQLVVSLWLSPCYKFEWALSNCRSLRFCIVIQYIFISIQVGAVVLSRCMRVWVMCGVWNKVPEMLIFAI